MGAASLREDEVERRGGEPRFAPRKRFQIDGLVPQSRPAHLYLTESEQEEFNRLISRLRECERFKVEPLKFKSDAKRGKALTNAYVEGVNASRAVLQFLAPRVLKLRSGEDKRHWQAMLRVFRTKKRI